MSKPPGAPGCFAAASVFSRDSDICQSCVAFEECTVASFETLQSIKHIIDVGDLLKRHERARKLALTQIAAADKKREGEIPPGNIERPMPVTPVKRNTPVVKVKFEATKDENRMIMTMSQKAKIVATNLIKQNKMPEIRKCLVEGKNHFTPETLQPWLRITIDALIEGGFTRPALGARLAAELKWTKGSGESHANMAAWIFTGFKMAQDVEGHVSLIPAAAQ